MTCCGYDVHDTRGFLAAVVLSSPAKLSVSEMACAPAFRVPFVVVAHVQMRDSLQREAQAQLHREQQGPAGGGAHRGKCEDAVAPVLPDLALTQTASCVGRDALTELVTTTAKPNKWPDGHRCFKNLSPQDIAASTQ